MELLVKNVQCYRLGFSDDLSYVVYLHVSSLFETSSIQGGVLLLSFSNSSAVTSLSQILCVHFCQRHAS